MKDELIERLKARKQIPISIASRAGLESPTDPLCLEAAQQGAADNARIAALVDVLAGAIQRLEVVIGPWRGSVKAEGLKFIAEVRALTQEATNGTV